jgi:epoxyqueuosine reductase
MFRRCVHAHARQYCARHGALHHRLRELSQGSTFVQPTQKKKNKKKKKKDFVDGFGPATFDPDHHADGLTQALNAEAKRLGLGPTTITTPERVDTFPQYMEWLGEGRHGEMGYLARKDRVDRRNDMNVILPGVQSVICTSLVYWPGRDGFPAAHTVLARDEKGHSGAPQTTRSGKSTGHMTHGAMSCYAWGEDYHEILGRKLRQLAVWLHGQYGGEGAFFVDTGALLERGLAARAGLGCVRSRERRELWPGVLRASDPSNGSATALQRLCGSFVGKNSMLISERLGSGLFLGQVLSTLPLPAAPPRKKSGACGKCNKVRTLPVITPPSSRGPHSRNHTPVTALP